jgi:predicted naringenin-chalcone synthase
MIAATATALPQYTLERDDEKTYVRKIVVLDERRLEAMMTVIDNAQVHKRHAIYPVEEIIQSRPLEVKSDEYPEHAVRLGREAVHRDGVEAARHSSIKVTERCESGAVQQRAKPQHC